MSVEICDQCDGGGMISTTAGHIQCSKCGGDGKLTPKVVSMFDRKPVDAGEVNPIVVQLLEAMLAEAKRGEISGFVAGVLRPNGLAGNCWAVPNDKLVQGVGTASMVLRCFQDMLLGGTGK